MSIDQRKEIMEGLKGILWIVLVILGFMLTFTLQRGTTQLEKIEEKIDNLNTRVIRIEYELKLR